MLSSALFSKIAASVGMAGIGPVAFSAVLAVTRNPWVAVAASGVALTPLVVRYVAQILVSRHEHGVHERAIVARSEARALRRRARTRSKVLLAGLDPAKAPQAAQMLRLECMNADLPDGKRLQDRLLGDLLMLGEGGPRPPNPRSGPDASPPGQVIVFPRPQEDLSARAAAPPRRGRCSPSAVLGPLPGAALQR